MTHILLRRQAIELRKLGKSYGQIKTKLGISKSTLSGWLKEYPLTNKQLEALNADKEIRIERYRGAMQRKRQIKFDAYYQDAKSMLLPLSKKELLVAGVFLYWGEGTKTLNGQLVVANTDPALVQFALLWMTKGLDIPKEKIHVLVHLYKDMDIEDSLNYWSKLLQIPRSQFSNPYIKSSNRSDIDYRGYGHGTCNLRVYNAEMKHRILMAIKAVADYSKESVDNLI